jgi:hypothetical protein
MTLAHVSVISIAIILKCGENQQAYEKCKIIADRYQIEIDSFDANKQFIPTLNKLSCKKWWHRRVNKHRLQIIGHCNCFYRNENG